MKGIYKITTPSGYVYIGQSVNIERRWKDHKWPTKKSISVIGRSILKYGHENHVFKIVHELPIDCDQKTLSLYEHLYMSAYRDCGVCVLNISDIKDSNYGYCPSEEQRRNHGLKMKGRPSKRKGATHTVEVREIIKAKRALQVMPKGFKRTAPVWNKGLKGAQVCHMKGKSHSDETKEKLRIANLGKKLSAETIAKRTATLKINGVKRRWTDEAKLKQSNRMKGEKISIELLEKRRMNKLLRKNINGL